MARITIRDLDETVEHRLQIRAAERGRSIEEEVREILGRAIHDRFAAFGGVELELPVRGPMRERP